MGTPLTKEEAVEIVVNALPPSQSIPTLPIPYYTQRTRLDGKDYNLHFAYNERMDRWSLDIFSDDDRPLVLGIRIVANWSLIRFYQYNKDLPPGELMAIDLSGDGSPPGFNELGFDKRVVLTYFPLTDL